MNVKELLDQISSKIDIKDTRIKFLQDENKRLKDKNYKDIELLKLKSELEKVKKDLYRGFPITEDEMVKIRDWEKKHEENVHGLKTLEDRLKSQGCGGGTYEYRFYPTSIGVCAEVVCNRCGDKFTFQEI